MSGPITRRFPGEWCHRTRVWWPDPFRGSTHASLEAEGGMDPRLGEFLKAAFVHGLDEETLGRLEDLTRAIRSRRAYARRLPAPFRRRSKTQT
jgi:hypothetical protein